MSHSVFILFPGMEASPLGMGWQCITRISVASASAPSSSFGFGPSSAQIPPGTSLAGSFNNSANSRSCGTLNNGKDPPWRIARERDVLLSDTRWAELHPSLVPSSTSTSQIRGTVLEHSIFQALEASRLSCVPDSPVLPPKGVLRLRPVYLQLKYVLDESDPAHANVLNNIKRKFREETFTRENSNANFAMVHYSASDHATESMPALSYQCLQTIQPLSDEELYDKIRRTVPNKHSLQVLESFLIFNKHIPQNQFLPTYKGRFIILLGSGFLPEVEYPKKPFAMFFVIGNESREFHFRFKDVARGGIRIVMSRNKEMYSINQRMLFDENYNLASTQSLKNKDVPEGGAKGTILPSIGATPRLCFEKYVDAIVDLLIPGKTPGIKETLVDLYEKPELLFFGPDEGTADIMDWAALHARDRGAETWCKSFTTGKSAETLGGVPHDTYGMTSLSIRQYVLGIYKQLGLKEKKITKVQTSGPDGDLGSNEILLSSDKTVAIIGVLADPTGLDREELVRLAKKRLTIAHFDRTRLSKDGYLVKIEEQDIKLPSGEIVLDGTDFRIGAHLRFKADLFVPCGGRYVFKDSSTNKGGVTSSSLEVLAGLALSTQEYVDLMIFKDGKPSDFYQSYVKDIQEKITKNAAAEFHCLWKEHTPLQGAKPRTTFSDELSSTLNNLQAELESSDLFEYVPREWGDKEGDTQGAYQRALFSSWVASHFIYKYGVNASSVDFFHFARDLSK
ncbi:NAD(P)-binding protein [Gymnopus androsaceus JB14]|uniref:NAD(P)-binding protein n=1 Tax=Gymnopus androsaceus JB14 TaxID=1447944 RepID=A0A6A4GU54_9AGAR|nr:NAD(P)-binding protein [Gymnopus androsaceus JB14]